MRVCLFNRNSGCLQNLFCCGALDEKQMHAHTEGEDAGKGGKEEEKS